MAFLGQNLLREFGSQTYLPSFKYLWKLDTKDITFFLSSFRKLFLVQTGCSFSDCQHFAELSLLVPNYALEDSLLSRKGWVAPTLRQLVDPASL